MRSMDLSTVTWRKSRHNNSDGGACIDVSDDFPAVVPVRDSKSPHGPALVFGTGAWASFVDGVKAGGLTA